MTGLLLKLFFGKGVNYKRFFNRSNPDLNRTVIVVQGDLRPAQLAGALRVLKGEAHARAFPSQQR